MDYRFYLCTSITMFIIYYLANDSDLDSDDKILTKNLDN